jgi:putative membrane protein
MAWVKAFHIIFMVTWFAGLFYLPRLFVYHAMSTDMPGIERFKIMERKLFNGIMMPGGVLTLVFGSWLLLGGDTAAYLHSGWMQIKLALVGVLVAYHLYLGKLRLDFKHDRNRHGHVYYRWLNEFPVLILIAVAILVEVQPF